jgi:thioredoxin-like negative regulator of GroEL
MLPRLVQALLLLWVEQGGAKLISLDHSKFQDAVSGAADELVVVNFYSPWCEHCKRLAPYFEGAADVLKRRSSSVVMATVNAEKEVTLAQQFYITAYPSWRIFHRGQPYVYRGIRDDSESIATYIQSWTEPVLPSEGETMELTDDTFGTVASRLRDSLLLVEFFSASPSRIMISQGNLNTSEEFDVAAGILVGSQGGLKADIRVARIDALKEPTAALQYGVSKSELPTLKILYREEIYEYEGPMPYSSSELVQYVHTWRVPRSQLVTLNAKTFGKAIKNREPTLVAFMSPNSWESKELLPVLVRAAGPLKRHGIVLAQLDAAANQNKKLVIEHGVQRIPQFTIFQHGRPRPYRGPGLDATGHLSKAVQHFGIVNYMLRQRQGHMKVRVLDTSAEVSSMLFHLGDVVPGTGPSPGGKNRKFVAQELQSEAAVLLLAPSGSRFSVAFEQVVELLKEEMPEIVFACVQDVELYTHALRGHAEEPDTGEGMLTVHRAWMYQSDFEAPVLALHLPLIAANSSAACTPSNPGLSGDVNGACTDAGQEKEGEMTSTLAKKMIAWLRSHRLPLVTLMTKRSAATKLLSHMRPLGIMFLADLDVSRSSMRETKFWLSQVLPVATHFSKCCGFNFVFASALE